MFYGSLFTKESSALLFEENFQFYDFRFRNKQVISFKNLNLTFYFSKSKSNTDFIFQNKEAFVFFYGNLYNKKDLIEKNGQNPDISTPELIHNLFLNLDSTFFNELNGDFSVIIYDSKKNSFIFVRDHIGVIPFFYTVEKNNFHFSSDDIYLSKQFITNNKAINDRFILSFFKTIDDENYFSKSIFPILPGHFLELEKEKLYKKKYWFPEKIKYNTKLNFNEITEKYQLLLRNAVDIRINYDKSNAAHISGGLDSAFIAARLKEKLKEKFIFGFSQSTKFSETVDLAFNEFDFVEEIENTLNIKVNYTNFNENTFENLFLQIDSNLATFHEFNMIDFCFKNELDVVFSGYAGDDFASINNYGIEQDLFFTFRWKFFKRFKTFKKKLKIILFNVIFPFFGIIDRFTFSMLKNQGLYLNPNYNKIDGKLRNSVYQHRSRRNRHLKAISSYGITRNIEYLFQMGNRKGVEYRFPLVDKRIIEFMLSIPSDILVDYSGKYHNRILMRDLCANYYSENIYQRKSKSDPYVEFGIEQFYKSVGLKLIDNFDKYKIEILSKIVNFEKLEKSIENINKNSKEENESLFDFLICLEYCYKHLEQNDKIY